MSTDGHVQHGPGFLPVAIDTLDFRAHDLDLFVRYDASSKPALYRGRGIAFTQDDVQRLIEQGIRYLYIPSQQHGIYRRALTDRLDRIFSDQQAGRAERGRILRAACAKMVEDVLAHPGRPEPVAMVQEIANRFAAWAAADGEGFSYILDMSAHDFCTAAHMVNVGVGCGLLIEELRPGSDLLAVIQQGGLLHDVGKRGVPDRILNKEGRLSPQEWSLLRNHPTLGHDELRTLSIVPPTVLSMARDHHERIDGKGYPGGIRADRIGLAARICTVVDVFDAITATRPYRGPTPPLDALKIMEAGSGTHFDPDVLKAWGRIVHRMIDLDAARAVPASPKPPTIQLDDLLPSATRPAAESTVGAFAGSRPTPIAGDNRRNHGRYACDLPVQAIFIRQLKPCPIKPGQTFDVRALNVSQSGLQLRTPWPLTINDLLMLHLTRKDGSRIERLGLVVRVRQNQRSDWVAGVCFVTPDEAERAA